jgi:hypothetical protein
VPPVPVLRLSPLIQGFFGIEEIVTFPGDAYVLWELSSAMFACGGHPFIHGHHRRYRNHHHVADYVLKGIRILKSPVAF